MLFFKFKKLLTLIVFVFIRGFVSLANAQAAQEGNYGLDASASKVSAFSEQISDYNANFLNTRIGSIIGIALSFIGVIFLILMIYAGISWMTASGNQEKVTKAKDLIINAIIGLIIVLAAYAITSFIGNRLM